MMTEGILARESHECRTEICLFALISVIRGAMPGWVSTPRGIFALVRLGRSRFDSENRFAFLHQIEPVARDRFQIRRIGLEQIHFTGLAGKQYLLLIALRLKIIDLGVTDLQFFIRRDKHAHDHEPDRE